MPAERLHFGDPCIHCDTPHDAVPVGPCLGDAPAIPIAYAMVERRWDTYERFRIRFSDGHIEERWSHPSFHAPYYHFGYSDELRQPPAYDPRLKGPDHAR